MKYLKFVLTLSFAAIVSACASVQYAELSDLPTTRSDGALVFFFRESKFQGSGVSYHIYEKEKGSEKKPGALQSGTFFYIYRQPGTHTFWAKTEAKDSVTLDLEASETYYIKGEVDMGFFVGRPDLTIVHPAEGASEIPELKYATLPDKI